MEFKYGPIQNGRSLNVEDIRQSALGVTWMDGEVVVAEKRATTNSKSLVREPGVEHAMVKGTMQESVLKGKVKKEIKEVVANQVVANKLQVNQVVANKLQANQGLANQVVANQGLANMLQANQVVANQGLTNKLLDNKEVDNLGYDEEEGVVVLIPLVW